MRRMAHWPMLAAAILAGPGWASTLKGNVEGVYWRSTGWHLEGWTCQANTNQSLDVVFYIDAPWPNGIPWSGVAANRSSEPGVGTACATTLGAHRFSYRIPYASLKQYAGRPVISYAQLGGATLGIIPTAGVTLPAQPFKSQILGNNEGVATRTDGTQELIGWACAHGLTEPAQVHIYAGQPWPNGVMIGSVLANQASEPAVGVTCGTGAAHRFRFPLTAQLRAAHAGKALFAHAMNDGAGANELIAGQGTMPAAPVAPEAPAITPSGSTVIQDGHTIAVQISTPTAGATVRYATGAITPDCASAGAPYFGPISVNGPTTIRALSCANGMASAVVSASFNVTLRPPTFSALPSRAGAPITVSLAEPSGAAMIRYALAGTPNCGTSSVYTGPVTIDGGTPAVLRAISCRTGYTDSAVVESQAIQFQAETPVIQASSAGATSHSITMASSTPGATIRFATDTSPLTCSSGSVYGGPFVTAKSSRLRALACRSGYLPSAVAEHGALWNGPDARVVSTPSGRRIQVDGKVLSPIYLAFNGAACASDCVVENARFVDQVVRAYDAKALRSQTDVLIEYNVPRFQGALDRLSGLVAQIKAARPEAKLYFILRFEVFPLLPSQPDDDHLQAESLFSGAGEAWSCSSGDYSCRPYRRMDGAWVSDRSAKVMAFMRAANQTPHLSGAVVGAFFTYMEGGEFFTEARHPVPEASRPWNSRPWVPEFKNQFFYSATSPALLSQRLNPTAGAFVDGPAASNAINEAEQQAVEVVDAIAGIARNVKAESGSRLLVKVFYGYNTGLGVRRAAGRHHALGRLLASPDVDMIAAPYSYAEGSRQMRTSMLPQTTIDSIRLAGKLAVVEDDTRTHVSYPTSFGYAQTSEDSAVLLARNAMTSILRGANVHLLDLQAKGWFLDPTPNATFTMARTLANVGAIANTANLSATPGFRAQVAVFIDEAGVKSMPIQGVGGTLAYQFAEESGNRLLSRLAGLGAPIRNYLLSDFAKIPDDELFALRLFVLPDAYRRSAELRGLMARVERLHAVRGSNARPTFLFLYAPGVLANSSSPPSSYTLSYTPHGTSTEVALLRFRLRAGGSRLGAFSCAHDLAALPFPAVYALDEGQALASGWTAGFCDGAGERAYGLRELSRFRVAFAADPAIPTTELARMMDLSGVHRFLNSGVVEAQGDTLMVYRTGSTFEDVRPTAELPTLLEYPDIFKTPDPSQMTLLTRAKRAQEFCLGGSCGYFPKLIVYRMTRQ